MKHFRLIISRSLLVSGLLMLSSVVYASQADNDIIEKMGNHWQQIINEKDDKTRKKMITEHRKMMEENSECISTFFSPTQRKNRLLSKY